MKQKTKITEKDYINAIKKADREFEIAMYGKQVSMRGSITHKSKKAYNRQEFKKFDW